MPVRSLVRALLRPFAVVWRAPGGLAEDVSRLGHAGGPWREDIVEPNPYAGAGPRRDDSRSGGSTRR